MAVLIFSARAAMTQAIPTPLQGRTIQLPTPRQHIEAASFIHQSLLTLIQAEYPVKNLALVYGRLCIWRSYSSDGAID
jgi:hypothetical protein